MIIIDHIDMYKISDDDILYAISGTKLVFENNQIHAEFVNDQEFEDTEQALLDRFLENLNENDDPNKIAILIDDIIGLINQRRF